MYCKHQAEWCTPRGPMCLDIKSERKQLDEEVPILLVLHDEKLKVSDEHVAETFGLSARLRLVGFRGEFLHSKERTKRREEFVFKLGLILGHEVVLHMI